MHVLVHLLHLTFILLHTFIERKDNNSRKSEREMCFIRCQLGLKGRWIVRWVLLVTMELHPLHRHRSVPPSLWRQQTPAILNIHSPTTHSHSTDCKSENYWLKRKTRGAAKPRSNVGTGVDGAWYFLKQTFARCTEEKKTEGFLGKTTLLWNE
jgi:hypothetical protein